VSATDIAARICDGDFVPTLPPVLAAVMARCQDEDVDFGELSLLVSADPALAARILGMANSCLLGGRVKIVSIRSALARLGLRLTHATVLGFALTSRLERTNGFDAQAFWRYALTTSNAARLLAKKTRKHDPDEAFAAGLLQDVGVLPIQCILPDECAAVMAECESTGVRQHEIEERLIGATHMEIGSRLLQKWGLPEELHQPILYHHCSDQTVLDGLPADVRGMAELLSVADMVAQVFVGPDHNICRSVLFRALDSQYGIRQKSAERILEQVSVAVERAAEPFELDMASMPSYDQIRALSARRIIQLAAEMEAGFREYQARANEAREALSRLQAEHEAVSRRAAYDDLTGAMARGEFMDRLAQEVERAADAQLPLAVLFLDVDHFKWVNDRLGHLSGDTVLRSLGQYLSRTVRRSDMVGRYGGDEFAVLLPEVALEAALEIAQRVQRRVVSLSPDWLEDFDGITISVGLVHVENVLAETEPSSLLAEADACLYAAKSEGRNCVRYRSL